MGYLLVFHKPFFWRFLTLSFYIPIIVDFIKKVVASQATIPPSPLTYLYCNILPVHLYVLGEAPRASPCAGFGSLAFFLRKKSPDALLLSLHAWRFFF